MEMTNPQKAERYIQNLRKVRALSKPQFSPETAPDVLLETIQGNAVRCYELMRENNAILSELIYTRDPVVLTDDDIADLEDFAGKMFNYAHSEDAGIAYKIYELLLKAARLRKDTPMIIKELYYCGVSLHYVNISDPEHNINLLGHRVHAYMIEGAGYIAQYEELDHTSRQYIIRCVGNTRLSVSRYTHKAARRYMRLFDQAMGIIQSPYYQKLDPDIPWNNFIYSMHMDRMTLMCYLREHDDPEIAQKVLESATYVYERKKPYQSDDARLQNWRVEYYYHAARYHAGLCTAQEATEALLEIVERSDDLDYSPEGINRNLTAYAYSAAYEKRMTPEERAAMVDRFHFAEQASRRYLENMPSNEYPRVASSAMRELLLARSYLENPNILDVFDHVLAGHKPTFVHSQMVAHLTRVLVRRLLDTNPAALIGVLDCETVEAVQSRREEILLTAYHCGLYHDVGKSAVIMYIDTNSRCLLDEEFLCVQSHPEIGYCLLCDAGYDEYLAPAARYHHCFYDGRGGYPKELPPCPRNVKPIVDALSVADSLDAATDNIGRCYNMAKPFRTLLGELRAQSGSRYAPAVVALFQDEGFCGRLAQKLDQERKKVYLQVYHVGEEQ